MKKNSIKKIVGLLLLAVITLTILQSCSRKLYTEKTFYGTWTAAVDEPIDGNCTIEVTWKEDNTTDVVFYYENGSSYRTNTTWKYKNNIYDEVYEDGTKGKAKIDWINKNKFALTILQNQDSETYKNKVRIYERKGK